MHAHMDAIGILFSNSVCQEQSNALNLVQIWSSTGQEFSTFIPDKLIMDAVKYPYQCIRDSLEKSAVKLIYVNELKFETRMA